MYSNDDKFVCPQIFYVVWYKVTLIDLLKCFREFI